MSFEIKIDMTRGTGSNDKEKITATIEAESLDELEEKQVQVRQRLEMLAQDIRSIQPNPDSKRDLADDQSTLEAEV